MFAPAFHQALRWSTDVSDVTTFRMRVPVARAGERVRVVFRAGDSSMSVLHASVAPAGDAGVTVGDPLPLTFEGQAGASADTRGLLVSDPVELKVTFDEELFVTFAATGAVAQSGIDAFPGSLAAPGDQALAPALSNAESYEHATGVATVEVEAAPTAVFVAVGDSITEGYSTGSDDYRNGWTHVLEAKLGLPVANAGVSGQGLDDALANLDGEVLALENVTDCVVLIGTNDLWDYDAATIEAKYAQLISRLKPFCRVWGATLLPKERNDVPATRYAVNDWLRTQADVAGVIDFESALEAAPDDPDHFAPGLGEDGIHPTVAGYAVMGQTAYDYLSAHAK